jgi:hypothetical protein
MTEEEIMLRQFVVNKPDDWHPVRDYLRTQADIAPLRQPDSDNYSSNEQEAFERSRRAIEAGRSRELMRYSAAVIYQRHTLISLALTTEPNDMHLSMTRIVPPGKMARLPDSVAREAAQAILDTYEERQEGVLAAVRHFYRAR